MTAWSNEEEERLLSTLQLMDPDACPCDLGRLLGQPCMEVPTNLHSPRRPLTIAHQVALVRQHLIDQGRLPIAEREHQGDEDDGIIVFSMSSYLLIVACELS